ncbi:MAG: biotin/lipoyl-binding carrier protein [Rhizobiales bacterium]|nr:biotin/lipoyl-binding carrier protein [Hyphomicrobiales bacterium]
MGTVDINSEMTGSVWKIVVETGQRLAQDDTIMIMESMKMEIPVLAPEDGIVTEIAVAEGDPVTEGMLVARMSREA